ncbi:MAG TPA: septum formation initiator family protein [Candidatus Eremiobacteraceae bacterium]|nr:septum formation initiator family protein [Candidatus Eremiobacteraceae bacterium]
MRRGSLGFKALRLVRAPLRASGGRWREAVSNFAVISMRCAMAAVIVAVLGASGLQAWRVGAQSYDLHKQIVAVERHEAELTSSETALQTQIKDLHDPEYLVPLIHEQLGLVKPHEVFIVVRTQTPPANR